MKKIVVLGGYGNFGKRIVEELSQLTGIAIYIAGRNVQKANHLIEKLLNQSKAELLPLSIDITASNFQEQLQAIKPFLVIHTSGPFQGQDYRVPEACIDIGAHYIDLADDRRFVCDITQLDIKANNNHVLAVSGASSVPGLSSVILDHYYPEFSQIYTIDISIAPGNKAERGEATIRGILSYTGHPFPVFRSRQWVNAYGWMDSRRINFNDDARQLANVDVPDLELFPKRYSVKDTVKFQAGLELTLLHQTMVFMAWLAKKKIIKNWAPLTKPIMKTSNLLKPFGTDRGYMRVLIEGKDLRLKPKAVEWTLTADKGVGPYIPTLSAIIIAKKLINNQLDTRGAMPCLGLYTLDEFSPYAKQLGLQIREQAIG
ncbi:saccharopine dehydrogenase family protein [Kangiella aquimarina]|uniref:Saccharopine dehydrogenase NADP-binding domain-containing protein n=1 Tax=Kangiella aquimarina TaxID=261965 RepID=A0ABZ0X3K2_9GAMM|nr:saccharopine dehydrogenase NADP-binding domain-containing protein [Kangiella aquimarina]WQG85178.1 saccharopine dehydrogenase NADP-binding domain-containing protein [Kangiella aquimarina]